jgi:hypothetical protein
MLCVEIGCQDSDRRIFVITHDSSADFHIVAENGGVFTLKDFT